MVKNAELLDNLLRAPGKTLSCREFERLTRAFGFVLARRRGSHCAYKHPAVSDLLTVQPHGKDARP
jgi:predicted RNA binding protein YcfA (HicA-like mRNA interferase family)